MQEDWIAGYRIDLQTHAFRQATGGCLESRRSCLGRLLGDHQCIQHRPQNIALEAKRNHGCLLHGSVPAILQRHPQGELGIFACLGESRPKVVESLRCDPGVMFLKSFKPLRHQFRGEQLRQRRGDGNGPWLRPRKIHDRHRRQNALRAGRGARPSWPHG